MTRQHVGILATILGTVILAYSLQVKRQYQGEMASVVDKMKQEDPALVEPTESKIVPWRFYAGLIFIGVGSLLQW